jgi:hypothetical protein
VYIKALQLDVMPWPPGSPYMNTIKHVWAILKAWIKRRKAQPSNLEELWEATQCEWYAIPKEQITKLYDSIPWRIATFIETKGWYTKC